MSYVVTCQCGKRLTSNHPIAGRRIRCPACGQTFVAGATSDCPPVSRPSDPPTGNPPVVFVSHSAKDAAVAAAVCSALEKQRVRCWIAPRDILPGREWSEAIIDGISLCKIMVLIFSENSNSSPQVRREVERAVNKGLIVVPFRIADVPMAKSLEYFLSSPHWFDALTRPLDPHIGKLTGTIETLLRGEDRAASSSPQVPVRRPDTTRRNKRVIAGVGIAAAVLVLVAALWNWRPRSEGQLAEEPATSNAAVTKLPPPVEPSPTPQVSTTAQASPADAGKTVEKFPGSQVALRNGTLQVRSLRVDSTPTSSSAGNAKSKTGGAADIADVFGTAPGSSSKINMNSASDRWRIVSNTDQPFTTSGSSIRLQFQITNDSYEAVTLSNIELQLLGIVDLYEDQIADPQPPVALREVPARTESVAIPMQRADSIDVRAHFAATTFPVSMQVDESKPLQPQFPLLDEPVPLPEAPPSYGQPANVDLGIDPFAVDMKPCFLTKVRFNHALHRGELLAPCVSGNLLPADADSFLPANTGKKFTVDLSCSTLYELPGNMPFDQVSGPRQRQLTAQAPTLMGICHLLVLSVEVIGEDGRRHSLRGDHVYTLKGVPIRSDSSSDANASPRRFEAQPTEWDGQDLDATLAALLTWCMKSHSETVVFQQAQRCGLVPDNLDPLDITGYCHYGDDNSRFRQPATKSLEKSVAWPRSNVAEVLRMLSAESPPRVEGLTPRLTRMAEDKAEPALARRAAFVLRQLATPFSGPSESPVKSHIQR